MTTSSDPRAAACALVAEHAPPPRRRCGRLAGGVPGGPPLVVLAGMGKTGTMSLSVALAMLGLNVGHFSCVKRCRRGVSGGGGGWAEGGGTARWSGGDDEEQAAPRTGLLDFPSGGTCNASAVLGSKRTFHLCLVPRSDGCGAGLPCAAAARRRRQHEGAMRPAPLCRSDF